jgi:outer membrane protein OmpA-like peptidoglycan-associated protein
MSIAARFLAAGIALAATAGIAGLAHAQGTPSERDIAHLLGPARGLPTLGAQPAGPKGNPHTMHVNAPSSAPRHRAAGTATGTSAHPAASAQPSVSLPSIQFAFNSAELRPESIQTLQNLGNALNHELKDEKKFLIEGHTDAVGTPAYNLELSTHRAEAVKDYLVSKLGVAGDRLEAVGKGATDPADPRHPDGPENRRVVVVNLSHS